MQSTSNDVFRFSACLLIVATAIVSPWLLGGFSPWCYALAPLLALTGGMLWLFARCDAHLSAVSWLAVAVAPLLLGYVWIQSLPLPQSVLKTVASPVRLDRMNRFLQSDECGEKAETSENNNWDRISVDPLETRRQWSILATAFVVCAIATLLAGDELCRLMMVFSMAINGAAFGLFALYQRAVAPGMIYWTIKPRWQNLPFGAFVNRNHAGLFLALCGLSALFGICLLLSQRIARFAPMDDDDFTPSSGRAVSLTDLRMIWLSQKDSVLFSLAFCALFCAVSSIAAASRSGAIAFGAVVAIATLMLFISGADRRLILAIGVLGAIAAVVAGAKLSMLVGRFESDELELGWTGRLAHWSDVLDQSSEFAVTGVGYGGYAYATLPYLSKSAGAWFQHADNQFVEAFVELGAIGSAIVAGLIALFIVRCALLLRERDLQARIVGLFGFGLAAISTINAMGDFAIVMPGVLLPLALAVGFVLGYRTAPAKHAPASGWRLGGLLVLKAAIVGVAALATLIGVAHFANGRGEADRDRDPAQWIARNVARAIGEPSPAAIAGDADESIQAFIDRFRQSVEKLDPELLEEEFYTLENAKRLQQAAELDDADEVFRAIREAASSTESLAAARAELLTAVKLAPMRFENHLSLARVNLFLCPGRAVDARVSLACEINPTSGIESSKAGLISVINGDVEKGGALLAKALRESPRLERDIFAFLKSSMTLQDVLQYVLKQDARMLIRAADRYYNGRNEWFSRNMIYAQLRTAIESGEAGDLSDPERHYYLAKAKRMTGDVEGAIADYEAACEEWSTPLAWLRDLADYYLEQRMLDRAIKVYMRISREFPYDAGIERRIEALQKRQREELLKPRKASAS